MLDPDFLSGLSHRPLDEVRALRDDAAQEETDLSYLRRWLHARIDIVRAEQRRRGTGGSAAGGAASLVAELADVLADRSPATAPARGRITHIEPSRAESHRRHTEALVSDVDLSDVAALSGDELQCTLTAYLAEEQSVSQRRHEVQHVMDSLNDEMGARYRDGTASVDELLARERGAPVAAGHPAQTP